MIDMSEARERNIVLQISVLNALSNISPILLLALKEGSVSLNLFNCCSTF
jgi:hypothetical protein